MAHLDLDALRRARMEAAGEGHSFTYGGKEWQLPAELPLEFAIGLSEGRILDALRTVLDGRFDEFMSEHPSMPDYTDLTSWIAESYTGQSGGNSPASGSS